MTVAGLSQAEISHAARQAWVGFWHSCMSGAGGKSLLPFDADTVSSVLNGEVVDEGPPARPVITIPASPEASSWALQLEGDARISGTTLGDVLMALGDYFKVFAQIKKVNPDAYDYFSRVGAPMGMPQSRIRKKDFVEGLQGPIVDTKDLPAYLGIFFPRSKEEARDDIINDNPSLMDFQLYEKRRRNVTVLAPWKYTIYDHQMYSLDRDNFSKAERRRFPACGTWGMHYFIGIDERGFVHALPMKWPRYQRLPCGEVIAHQGFMVPPGLKQMAGKRYNHNVDLWSAGMFSMIRAFAATALLGVQLSIRQGNQVARFGIPLSQVRSFFRDRERAGGRRNPLLHFVGTHERVLATGKRVVVGEHLRGARHFVWRGYNIIASAPGIHHPSPEGMAAETLSDDDVLSRPDNVVTMAEVGDVMWDTVERSPRVRFRKGIPTHTFRTATLGVSAGGEAA